MSLVRSSADFSQTVRALGLSRSPWSLASTLFWLIIFGLWCVWFCLSPVRLYETTDRAHIEAAGTARPVEPTLPGRIVENRARLGLVVEADEVLARLDDREQRIRLTENENKALALESLLAAYDHEIAALCNTRSALAESHQAERDQHRATIATAQQHIDFAGPRAARVAQLLVARAVSQEEADEAGNRMTLSQLQLAESQTALFALVKRQEASLAEQAERLANLKRERAETEAALQSIHADRGAFQHHLELRVIRAPIAGRIGRVADFPNGSAIAVGETLASIVPDAEPRVIALFRATAIGRLRSGQDAELRLDAYPWTQFGSLPARVTEVGDETPDGWIRVELQPLRDSLGTRPVRHGMTGTVQATVEMSTPLMLALRALGRFATYSAAIQ